jgi:hypothetical protein
VQGLLLALEADLRPALELKPLRQELALARESALGLPTLQSNH